MNYPIIVPAVKAREAYYDHTWRYGDVGGKWPLEFRWDPSWRYVNRDGQIGALSGFFDSPWPYIVVSAAAGIALFCVARRMIR